MRIDHVAHPSRDPYETHRFYSGVLGLKLVQAYGGKELLLVYALPDGGNLVFSSMHDPVPSNTGKIAWQRRHVGLTLSSRAEFDRWLQRLKDLKIRHELIDNERLYFSDPDGLVLELEVESAVAANPMASAILARWRNG